MAEKDAVLLAAVLSCQLVFLFRDSSIELKIAFVLSIDILILECGRPWLMEFVST